MSDIPASVHPFGSMKTNGNVLGVRQNCVISVRCFVKSQFSARTSTFFPLQLFAKLSSLENDVDFSSISRQAKFVDLLRAARSTAALFSTSTAMPKDVSV